MVFFRAYPFVDNVCCFCEHALRGNFYKYHIAIFLKFLPDCRESSILEYCGTYNDTQHEGLKALCLFSKSHEFSNFEEKLDEETNGYRYTKEIIIIIILIIRELKIH